MRRTGLLVSAVLVLVVLSACTSGKAKKTSALGSTTTTGPSTLVTGSVFSPEKDSTQGVSGSGIGSGS